MKIIEAMKEMKRLNEKQADLQGKVAKYAADLDFETPTYTDQKKQLDEWLQSHSDTTQRIADLRIAIQRTNIETSVSIELGGKHVVKTIAEWIHWRRDLAKSQLTLWSQLQDRNSAGQQLRDGQIEGTAGGKMMVKIRRYYEPALRDEKMALYRTQPSIIDGTLEVTNATTDVIGL